MEAELARGDCAGLLGGGCVGLEEGDGDDVVEVLIGLSDTTDVT